MEDKIKKIYENDDYIVLDKPTGLTVNRSNTATEGTLQDLLDTEYSGDVVDSVESVDVDADSEADMEVEETEFSERSGIVHRLDKDTSGVLVVAKNEESFINLQKQFKERKTEKIYFALVYGEVDFERLEIDAPIKRNPENPLKLAVVSDGKPSQTFAEKVSVITIEGEEYTMLKVMPKTGRTHQIRVHLAAINHPIVGDQIYAQRNLLRQSESSFSRLMLHAFSLAFTDPSTGEYKKFETELPKEFNI